MTATAELIMFNLDSPDPRRHADFYHRILGWEVQHAEEQYAMVGNGTVTIGFGRIDDYQPPAWPDEHGVKRYHLDFHVDDLDVAEKECLAAGATKPEFQPGERWRVLLDPAGHPFCVCLRPGQG